MESTLNQQFSRGEVKLRKSNQHLGIPYQTVRWVINVHNACKLRNKSPGSENLLSIYRDTVRNIQNIHTSLIIKVVNLKLLLGELSWQHKILHHTKAWKQNMFLNCLVSQEIFTSVKSANSLQRKNE